MTENYELKVVALDAVSAAAALRAEPVLWRAIEVAISAGCTWEELEGIIERAGAIAQAAVMEDGMRVLRGVRNKIETQTRWS